MSTVEVDTRVARGGFRLHARFAAEAGDVVAVVGPNGAGKSTLLRWIAGLEPGPGRLLVDGRDVGAVPAYRRPVSWLPQDGALFPHLTARDNVAFGIGGRGARLAADSWLERLGIGELSNRRPWQLSGGQAARVALARALARRPRVLLLDEPFAALDVETRAEVRRRLRRDLAEFDGVTLVVTHDPVDVVALAKRLLAVEAGAVVQDDAVAAATRAPRSPWLAALVGANAYPGVVDGTGVVALTSGGRIVSADTTATGGATVLAVVPTHAVALHPQRPRGSTRNVWRVVVRDLVATGSRVRVRADGDPPVVAEVTAGAVADLGLHEGATVWAAVKATEVTVVAL